MNFQNIQDSLVHYRKRGFIYIEDAPWSVSRAAYYATKPSDAGPDVEVVVEGVFEQKFLVASGEQSFIQMLFDGRLLKKAICITPCFRTDKADGWHRPYFMKSELINADDPSHSNLLHMVHDAASFFEKSVSVKIIQTGNDSYDILEKYSRVELGSYGIRRFNTATVDQPMGRLFEWIYGTGCAEPRYSMAIKYSNSCRANEGEL